MSTWREHGRKEARRYAAMVGVRDDDVLLDIGANCGEVSRLWRGHRAQAVAVEPNRALQATLHTIHGVTVVEAAVVGDEDPDHVRFVEAARDVCSWIEAAYEDDDPLPPETVVRQYDVPTVRFSDLVARYQPTVIKVDIEGAEYLFAADFLALPVGVRALVVEWHGFGEDHVACAHIYDRLLTGRGWRARGDDLRVDFEAVVRGYLR